MFRHRDWFKERNPLLFPTGKLTQFCRSAVRVEYDLTADGVFVRESLPPNFINPSCPSDASLIEQFRFVFFSQKAPSYLEHDKIISIVLVSEEQWTNRAF